MKVKIMLLYFVFFCIASSVIFVHCAPSFGASPSKHEKQLIEQSPNFKNGKFVNTEETSVMTRKISFFKMYRAFRKGANERGPKAAVPTIAFDRKAFMNNDSSISLCWFGHSTTLLKIDNTVIITDPMFSKIASPFSFAGTKAFDYTNELVIDSLPPIDYVLISHDHYDHLDYNSIKQLDHKVAHYLVPLGVRAHLERWGVAPNKITESDWWAKHEVDSSNWFVNTPARHFSGRRITNRKSTLWSSWVMNIGTRRLFFGGDSGYGLHFKQIGDTYGPFDLTMIECGQYNENWEYIHSFPEQSVQANIDLQGKLMLPIHWGKFVLSLHHWQEPIERAKKEAMVKGAALINPTIGEIVKIFKEE